MELPELLTQEELCRFLGKSKAWAERGRWAGYGPAFIKVGRSVRYRKTDVLRWLDAQTRNSTTETRGAV